MSTASNMQTTFFADLLKCSHWLSGCSLGLLLLTLHYQAPEQRLLIAGAVLGLGMLLVSIWLCRIRSEPGWLLLVLPPLLNTTLPSGGGLDLQLPAAMLATCTVSMFLLRRWLPSLARLD